MKAILVREFGGHEVLRLEEVPTPKPAAGQVLVRIHAAGVNPYDTYMRAGTYARKPPLPYTPGSDGAGVVEAVGEGVEKVKPGDRVYTTHTLSGAYAEYTLALEQQVHHRLDLVHDPRLLGDEAASLAVRPFGILLFDRWNRDHAAVTLLGAQPAKQGAQQLFGIEAICLCASMFA